MPAKKKKKHSACPRCGNKKSETKTEHPRLVWDQCSKCGQQFNVR